MEGGRHPGGIHQGQESLKIAALQSVRLLNSPAVIVIEMKSAKHGPVAALPPQGGNRGTEVCLRNLPEELLAEMDRHGTHFPGDIGVILRQVLGAVVGAGVHDAQRVAGTGKVIGDGPDHRIGGVAEVDRHCAAHGRTHLVHQSAELSEVNILRILADFGQFDGVQLSVAEEVVEDVADQNLIGRRGAEAGTGEDVGYGACVEAADGAASLDDSRRHAPDQGGGGIGFLRPGIKVRQIHLQGGIALRPDPDDIPPVGGGAGQHVHVHAGAENTAPLVVRVIAPKLCASDRSFATWRARDLAWSSPPAVYTAVRGASH